MSATRVCIKCFQEKSVEEFPWKSSLRENAMLSVNRAPPEDLTDGMKITRLHIYKM